MPCTPPLQNPKYASDVDMPSQTKWRNVGWRTSTFFYSTFTNIFFIFVTFFTFLTFFIFFSGTFFLHLCQKVPVTVANAIIDQNSSTCWKCPTVRLTLCRYQSTLVNDEVDFRAHRRRRRWSEPDRREATWTWRSVGRVWWRSDSSVDRQAAVGRQSARTEHCTNTHTRIRTHTRSRPRDIGLRLCHCKLNKKLSWCWQRARR